jgi:hypothetical protein
VEGAGKKLKRKDYRKKEKIEDFLSGHQCIMEEKGGRGGEVKI